MTRPGWVTWIPVTIVAYAIGVAVSTWLVGLIARPLSGISDSIDRLGVVATAGVPRVILWPFMTLARPLFAAWPGPYLLAVALALGILALNVVWVLTSDAAFQEAISRGRASLGAKPLAVSWLSGA